jgi:hypothetical protein
MTTVVATTTATPKPPPWELAPREWIIVAGLREVRVLSQYHAPTVNSFHSLSLVLAPWTEALGERTGLAADDCFTRDSRSWIALGETVVSSPSPLPPVPFRLAMAGFGDFHFQQPPFPTQAAEDDWAKERANEASQVEKTFIDVPRPAYRLVDAIALTKALASDQRRRKFHDGTAAEHLHQLSQRVSALEGE